MIDADMERFIKLDKEAFNGKEATLRQQNEKRSLQLVYFELDADDADIRGGEPMFIDGECVGVTTSGGYGHRVGKSLGFGYLHPDNSAVGTAVDIDLVGNRRQATLLQDPVYDPANQRLRG